ncbi:MAG: hypothetical protein ABI430_01915 [Candidatus Taylorbacteria bacterium]
MESFQIFLSFYPLWVPLFLAAVLWKLWIVYIRTKFFLEQKNIVLELKIPREVLKTPLAMEVFLSALYQTTGEHTFIDRYWEGKVRPWFSLEIVSLGGQVKFFIWTWEKWKNFVESQLYAQYPGIEVHEVPDYAKMVTFDKEKYKLWACDFELSAPDPYPIKTYLDFTLESTQTEEENKTDPITNLIEALGSLGPGEQMWIQIMIRAHKAEKTKHGTWFEKVDWQHEAEMEIEKIKQKAKKETHGKDDGEEFSEFKLTSGDKEKIKAIERSIAKNAFDCGIRGIYLAEREKYRKVYEPILRTLFKPYSSPHLNGFMPNHHAWSNKFNYPWQDYKEMRQNRSNHHVVEAYKRRSFFHAPHQSSNPFVLNTEELATIYHFPGKVSETPTFDRIAAKKAEPPANLPI